jgi:hypothetical protein
MRHLQKLSSAAPDAAEATVELNQTTKPHAVALIARK